MKRETKRLAAAIAVIAIVFGVFASTAAAGRYYMTYAQAKHQTREWVKEVCNGISGCTGFGVGICHRNTSSNFSCLGGLFYSYSGGEEEECNRVYRWGVNGQGYIALRGYGARECFPV